MNKTIEIWQPRWHDRKALIAAYKVLPGRNLIRFTKAGAYNGIYAADGGAIRKCSLETNGKIECYAVPLVMLERINDGAEKAEVK